MYIDAFPHSWKGNCTGSGCTFYFYLNTSFRHKKLYYTAIRSKSQSVMKHPFYLRVGASPPSTSPPRASPTTLPSARSALTRPWCRGDSPTPARASSSSKPILLYLYPSPTLSVLASVSCKIRAAGSQEQTWQFPGYCHPLISGGQLQEMN